jgi:hypothetical protein
MKIRTRRWSVLAGGLLALSMVGAPALAAEPSADDPVATVNGLLDTIVAKDFAGVSAFVCAQYAEQVAGTFDLAAQMGELPGVDMTALINGLVFTADPRTATLVSNDGTNAVVDLQATLSMTLDETVARDFVKQLLEAQGQEASDAVIDAVLPQLMSEFEGQTTDLTEQVDLVLENGVWLVCEPFGSDESPAPSGDLGPTPSAMPAMSPAA